MPQPAKKPPSKATTPGDHPAPSRSVAQRRCHHHSAGTCKIPLRTKTKQVFISIKRRRKKKILKENYILSMFIHSTLKDSRGPSLEVAALGLPAPGPCPGSSGPRGRRG